MRAKQLCMVMLALLAVLPALVSGQNELDTLDPDFITGYLTRALASASTGEILAGAMLAAYHKHPLLSDFLDLSFPEGEHGMLWADLIAVHCSAYPALSLCADGKVADKFIAADADNIHPYLLKMQWLLQQDNSAAALQVLVSGLETAATNDRHWQKLALLRVTLWSSGYPADKLNLAAETYVDAVALFAFYNEILLACRENSVREQAWAESCLTLGARLEDSGTSLFAAVFGASIQRDVLLDTDPDAAELQTVLARRKYYDDIRTSAGSALAWWYDETFTSKPERFYADAIEFGELRALELALERAGGP
jgi:hypothetical protein